MQYDFISIPTHQPESLSAYCHQQLEKTHPDWLRAIYTFIWEWLDNDLYITVHTSGSTGPPKEIQLEKSRMRASAKGTGEFLRLSKTASCLLCLPMHYIAGKMMVVRAIELQLELIAVEPSTQPLARIKHRVDFAAMVPNQVYASLEHLAQVDKLLIGGGPVSYELSQQLKSLPRAIYHTYGMTETITHVAMKRLNGVNPDLYFKALPHVTFSTDDRDCLVIKAPYITAEPVATRDVVQLIDEKTFEWLGRYDHVIISGGIKVMAEKLEQIIAPLIQQRFFVAGLSHEQLGQQVVLILEGKTTEEFNEQHLLEQIKSRVPKHHHPRKVIWIPAFVETSSGKVKRKETLKFVKQTEAS